MFLMSHHIHLAHSYWEKVVSPGDLVIDATCGNGHDTFFLSQLGAKVVAYDIQEAALEATRQKVPDALYRLQSHEQFEESAATLIVYNLGYLPGGDKTLTTERKSTLQSVQNALQIAQKAISITCYPGHPEGAKEEMLLVEFVETLDPREWNVCYHRWPNRNKAPSLIWISRDPYRADNNLIPCDR